MAKSLWKSLAFIVFISPVVISCAKRTSLDSSQGHERTIALGDNEFYLDKTIVNATPANSNATFYIATLPNDDKIVVNHEFLTKDSKLDDTSADQRQAYGAWPNAKIYYEVAPELQDDNFVQKNFTCVATAQDMRTELTKAMNFYVSMGFTFTEVQPNTNVDRIRISTLPTTRNIPLATWKNIGGIQPLALTPNFCGRELKTSLGYHLGVILPEDLEPEAGLTGIFSDFFNELKDIAAKWKLGYTDAKTLNISGTPKVQNLNQEEVPTTKITVNLPTKATFLSYVVLARSKAFEPSAEAISLYRAKYADADSTKYEGNFCNSIDPSAFNKIVDSGDIEDSKTINLYISKQGNYDVLIGACVPQGFNSNFNPNKTNGDLACGNVTKITISIKNPAARVRSSINAMASLQTASRIYNNTAGATSNLRTIIQDFSKKGEACKKKMTYWTLMKADLTAQGVKQVGPLTLSNLYFTSPESYQDSSEDAELTGPVGYISAAILGGTARMIFGRRTAAATKITVRTILSPKKIIKTLTAIGAVTGAVTGSYGVYNLIKSVLPNDSANPETGTGGGGGEKSCSESQVAADQLLMHNAICNNQFHAGTVRKEMTRLLGGGKPDDDFDIDKGNTCH